MNSASLLDLVFLSDPQLSPTGHQAAVVQTVIHHGNGRGAVPSYRSSASVIDVRTAAATPLRSDCLNVTTPRFSPDDSSVAFRGQTLPGTAYQLYLTALPAATTPRCLTRLATGVDEFAWHPGGRSVALISRGESSLPRNDVVRIVDRIRYKQDGLGFLPPGAAQVYRYDIPTGRLQGLTALPADARDLAFNFSGSVLYFTAAASPDENDRWVRNIWALIWTSGSVSPLLREPMMLSAPAVSPDDRQIAFLAAPDPDNFANQDCLWLVSADGGDPVLVTDQFNAAPSIRGDARFGAYPNRPHWQDATTLIVNGNRDGGSGLRAVVLPSGADTIWQSQRRAVTTFSYAAGVAAFIAETPTHPGELFVRSESGAERQLTSVNQTFRDRYQLCQLDEPRYVATLDGQVNYWLLRPRRPRVDHAAVFEIHAGAQTLMGYGFCFEFHFLASRGFAVVFGNPVDAGSPRNSLLQQRRRGRARLERFTIRYPRQLMAIIEDWRAVGPHPEAPVHVTGGSSGGYMTNWLVSHTTTFRSAVTERSICDLISYYGTSDIGPRYTELEHGGNPWDHTQLLWQQSPLKYVNRVHTPMLILHADDDHRCPASQAEQWFTALKRVGRARVRMVRFPAEGHELSRSGRPDRRIARLEAMVQWFEENSSA